MPGGPSNNKFLFAVQGLVLIRIYVAWRNRALFAVIKLKS
jgi:hypothetical protein